METGLGPLIPEIVGYLSRVNPRGQQDADNLHQLIMRLEKHHGVSRKSQGRTASPAK